VIVGWCGFCGTSRSRETGLGGEYEADSIGIGEVGPVAVEAWTDLREQACVVVGQGREVARQERLVRASGAPNGSQ
jgi:hypothetical protein